MQKSTWEHDKAALEEALFDQKQRASDLEMEVTSLQRELAKKYVP